MNDVSMTDVCFYDDPVFYNADAAYNGTCPEPISVPSRRHVGVGRPSIEEEERRRKKRLNQRIDVSISSEIFKVNDWSFHFDPNRIRVLTEDEPVEVKVYALKNEQPQETTIIDSVSAKPIAIGEAELLPSVEFSSFSANEILPFVDVEPDSEEETEISVGAELVNKINVISEIIITNKDSQNKILTVEATSVALQPEKEEIKVYAETNDITITKNDSEDE